MTDQTCSTPQANPTFKAYDEGAEITYNFLLRNDKPVKLGDGTFGCVFHVQGRNENCALKIFYETDDSFIRESQEFEMSIGRRLREFYMDDPTVASAINQYLVVPVSSLEDFDKSDAGGELSKYFSSLSFKLSENAIVMQFYPMSLKDLMERGWPTSAKGISGKTQTQGRETARRR